MVNSVLILGHLRRLISSVILLVFVTANASAGETEDFVDELKSHYEKTRSIQRFSLNYHFLNKQYRTLDYWEHAFPDRVMSLRMVEVDLEKKHFYDNDILYAPGGKLLDRVQFQNDSHSYYYEKNGNVLGKGFLNRGMGNFDRFMGFMAFNVDFLAVRPLLDEINIQDRVTLRLDQNAGTTTLTHNTFDNSIIDYEFDNVSLRLLSIVDKTRSARYVYNDYQTTRGLTYARSVNKFYNGDSVPAYISFNDKFDIIDQVDKSKLHLPSGYGPELSRGDGVLVSEEIADDLFLVTDSSAWRNSLIKVKGDDIMLFGASSSGSLADKMVKLITQLFPNKKISSIHVTHPHRTDIAGLGVYAKLGAEILADEYTISGIKAFPDFAAVIDQFKFRVIENKQKVDDVQFYVLETMHSKQQSFVHFANNGVIFQADFLNIAFDNTIPNVIPNYTRAFIDFIRHEELDFNRIVGNYKNNDISVEVVNSVYNATM